MEIFDLSEENELDTYMSREVPILEGDEAQSLTPEELGQGQEDHCWFSHESTCTTSFFHKYTERDVLFLYQAIWRKEHTSEDDPKKQIEEIKEEVKNAEVVIATLNGLPGSWDPFIQRMYARRKRLLSARLIRREEEDGSNWRSSSHHSKKIPHAMRNMKNSRTSYSYYHLDKKWWFHEWRRW